MSMFTKTSYCSSFINNFLFAFLNSITSLGSFKSFLINVLVSLLTSVSDVDLACTWSISWSCRCHNLLLVCFLIYLFYKIPLWVGTPHGSECLSSWAFHIFTYLYSYSVCTYIYSLCLIKFEESTVVYFHTIYGA